MDCADLVAWQEGQALPRLRWLRPSAALLTPVELQGPGVAPGWVPPVPFAAAGGAPPAAGPAAGGVPGAGAAGAAPAAVPPAAAVGGPAAPVAAPGGPAAAQAAARVAARAALAASQVTVTTTAGGQRDSMVPLTNATFALLDGKPVYTPKCRERVLKRLTPANWSQGKTQENKRTMTYGAWAAVEPLLN